MTAGMEKLAQDVDILITMAAEMEKYLRSDVLFWNMGRAEMPALTLGSYLMRQYRLLELEELLSKEQESQVEAAVAQFNRTLVEKIVLVEQKSHRELEARLRQWQEYLSDVERNVASRISNYATAVEVRAMIAALFDQLELPPYELDPSIPRRVNLLDAQLRRHWEAGEFVWPEEWKAAYPQSAFWWLYGQPRER